MVSFCRDGTQATFCLSGKVQIFPRAGIFDRRPGVQKILFGRLLEFPEGSVVVVGFGIICTVALISLLVQHVFICHLRIDIDLTDVVDGIHVAAMAVLYQQTVQCKSGDKTFKMTRLYSDKRLSITGSW